MKETLNEEMFVRRFVKIRPENFSREGLYALYGYLEEIEPEMEFDPIAMCCEFAEYGTIAEYNDDYGTGFSEPEEIDELVATFDGGFLVHQH